MCCLPFWARRLWLFFSCVFFHQQMCVWFEYVLLLRVDRCVLLFCCFGFRSLLFVLLFVLSLLSCVGLLCVVCCVLCVVCCALFVVRCLLFVVCGVCFFVACCWLFVCVLAFYV